MLHDRFYSRWDQPLALLQSGQTFKTTVLIKIAPSGHIISVSLAKPSGSIPMDDSVMSAAQLVTQVDPLPAGITSSEVKIEFVLSP